MGKAIAAQLQVKVLKILAVKSKAITLIRIGRKNSHQEHTYKNLANAKQIEKQSFTKSNY